MTAIVEHPVPDPARAVGTPRLLAGVTEHGHVDHTRHLLLHGTPVLRRKSWLVGAAGDVNLLGRGGAAFPVAVKLEATPAGARTTVLVNGSEGEPASRKDRTLMTYAPHLVLDGALVVAHALGTRRITVAAHDDAAFDALVHARTDRTDADDVRIVHTHDGFVGGEVRALINGLDGKPAVPGGRRVLPHVRGVEQRPTFASNVETFAQLAVLARLGVAEYARTGSANEPGTSLVTLLGDIPHAGVVEVPHGMPLDVLLPGSHGSPVLIGGYHGTWVRGTAGLLLDRAALAAAGSPLGAGVIARPYAGSCVLDEVVRVSRWLADQSTGQCGPCRFGLPTVADDLAAVAAGAGPGRLDQMTRRLDLVRGRGACAHPDGSVRFISSAVDVLSEEVRVHAQHGSCGRPASVTLPVGGAS